MRRNVAKYLDNKYKMLIFAERKEKETYASQPAYMFQRQLERRLTF